MILHTLSSPIVFALQTNKIANTTSSDEWMVSFTDIVREAYQGACTAWLKRELCVGNTEVSGYQTIYILFCSFHYLKTRIEMNFILYPMMCAGDYSFADQNAK